MVSGATKRKILLAVVFFKFKLNIFLLKDLILNMTEFCYVVLIMLAALEIKEGKKKLVALSLELNH